MKPIIRVENLGKQYQIGVKQGPYVTLRESITNAVRRPFSNSRPNGKDAFWALKDVNFEVMPGEVVGIIGRNGAGKSTLLKVLSRITEPTTGSVELYGRVGSLLEVGTGFHGELTGRENIYLNGAILGMHRAEITKKFDEIVDFAEIGDFLDTPVKRYSSGMYMRLAFAVAANLEPEVLIVDEVLAVGDAEFQKKCLGKMRDVATHGRTVLFVSHDLHAIAHLTKHALLLENGKIKFYGETNETIRIYEAGGRDRDLTYLREPNQTKPSITRVEMFTSHARNIHAFGAPLYIEFDVYLPYVLKGLGLAFQVINSSSMSVAASWVYPSTQPLLSTQGKHTVRCTMPAPKLYMGDYTLIVGLAEERGCEIFENIRDVCPFEIQMHGFHSGHPNGWIKNVATYIEDCHWEAV